MTDYQNNNTKLYFKEFLSKKELRLFINYHLQNRGKITRFVCYNKDYIIFQVKFSKNMAFNISNVAEIMDVKFDTKIITFTISKKNYKDIINEVLFYRKFPASIKKNNGNNFPII
jgi:hypothetical protein